MMRVAVLALQGAFAEHRRALAEIGVDSFEVRNAADWRQPKDALILPGGESTVQLKLLHDLDLYESVRQDVAAGLPTLGTCAGLILLAREVEHESAARLGTMDIVVKRNAYGRQLGSFHTEADFQGLGRVPMTFIRAPYIERVGPGAEALATVGGHIVAARQGAQIVTAFHPELDSDRRIYHLLLDCCRGETE
ncbi:5'-phosphate synthase pdxT subunit [Prevotella sp. kh1p2]|nr:5'-phosphate synthase pdxT subunit [Prevotella sp. kh1p2]SNU10446.1 5'-phosphate synthase pdxT subunit [Prevotellaceae bacterium KH2P17]